MPLIATVRLRCSEDKGGVIPMPGRDGKFVNRRENTMGLLLSAAIFLISAGFLVSDFQASTAPAEPAAIARAPASVSREGGATAPQPVPESHGMKAQIP